MLDESIAAHERATALDPTIVTSVPHTHFLRCDYHATLETYGGTRYYLDAAAWAALGDTDRATGLLRERLSSSQLSPMMDGLMRSLLAVLEQRRDAALATMRAIECEREPEVVFYLARHLAMLGAAPDAVRMLQRARAEGLTSSYTLEHDSAFALVRKHPDFREELNEATAVERAARRELDRLAIIARG
jgi:hypothetical protein